VEAGLNASQDGAAASRIENWFARRSPWPRRALAVLAGAIATLGHAPFQIAPLYIAAIVVLVWLLDVCAAQRRRLWSAFSTGWWFGLGHLASGLYWVCSAFLVDSAAWGPAWGVPAALALAGGLAVFWGLGCALAMTLWTRDVRRLGVFAGALFASEWLRGNVLTGFPWLLPGYIWTPGEPVSQLASLFGIYGLSLVTLLLAAAPAAIADGRSGAALRFAPTIAGALVLGMAWGWGAMRLDRAQLDAPGAQPVVRVADSGLSQKEKWCTYPSIEQRIACAPQQEWRVMQRYLDASGPPDTSQSDILIWPEGAIPTLNFFVLDNADFLNALARGLGDRALVMGFTRCAPHPACDAFMQGRASADALHLYNSAAVIDGVAGTPRIGQVYDKHHLVPGGEYIPFWPVLRHLHIAPLQEIGAGFTPGPAPGRIILPGAPPATVLICYEAIFPGLVPRGDERPGWIINISNDAWFGDPRFFSGPWQHFEIARYRSIEEGLPMARAASGGVSAIVDAYGRVVRSTFRRGGHAEAQLPPALVATPFAVYGNFLLITMLCLTAALRFLPPRRRTQDAKHE
jgi:apolipoprotein N-acyltransferase